MEKIEISEKILKGMAQEMEEELSLIRRSIAEMQMWSRNQAGQNDIFSGSWYQQIEDCIYKTNLAEKAYRQLADHMRHAAQSYDHVQGKAVQMLEDL